MFRHALLVLFVLPMLAVAQPIDDGKVVQGSCKTFTAEYRRLLTLIADTNVYSARELMRSDNPGDVDLVDEHLRNAEVVYEFACVKPKKALSGLKQENTERVVHNALMRAARFVRDSNYGDAHSVLHLVGPMAVKSSHDDAYKTLARTVQDGRARVFFERLDAMLVAGKITAQAFQERERRTCDSIMKDMSFTPLERCKKGKSN